MKAALFFGLRFSVAAPLCLLLWWELTPHYAWLVGQLSGGILSGIFSMPIESLRVDPAGIMNWQTLLVFVVGGRDQALPIAGIITNLPAYLALCLATGAITMKKRAAIAIGGCLILACAHVLYVVLVVQFGAFFKQWHQLVDMILLLPFLLWIVMVYGDQISAYFADDASDSNDET
jgi:hypothetical protein